MHRLAISRIVVCDRISLLAYYISISAWGIAVCSACSGDLAGAPAQSEGGAALDGQPNLARSTETRGSAGSSGAATTNVAGSFAFHTADEPQERFSIGLSTSDCREGCPTYDLEVNQSGMVEFNGRGNTRQQGMAVKTASPEVAMEIRQAIDATSFWNLRDVYRDMSDGCTQVDADKTTYTWNVSTQGTAKIVVDYQGCKGVSELDALRKIPQLLIDKLSLGAWLGR